jgi:hypothetical protein
LDATDRSTEGSPLTLREVPALPLRAGKHLASWVLWHTAKVNLAGDTLSPRQEDALVSYKRSA